MRWKVASSFLGFPIAISFEFEFCFLRCVHSNIIGVHLFLLQIVNVQVYADERLEIIINNVKPEIVQFFIQAYLSFF